MNVSTQSDEAFMAALEIEEPKRFENLRRNMLRQGAAVMSESEALTNLKEPPRNMQPLSSAWLMPRSAHWKRCRRVYSLLCPWQRNTLAVGQGYTDRLQPVCRRIEVADSTRCNETGLQATEFAWVADPLFVFFAICVG
jgi:hypothetical protein